MNDAVLYCARPSPRAAQAPLRVRAAGHAAAQRAGAAVDAGRAAAGRGVHRLLGAHERGLLHRRVRQPRLQLHQERPGGRRALHHQRAPVLPGACAGRSYHAVCPAVGYLAHVAQVRVPAPSLPPSSFAPLMSHGPLAPPPRGKRSRLGSIRSRIFRAYPDAVCSPCAYTCLTPGPQPHPLHSSCPRPRSAWWPRTATASTP